MKRLLTVLLTNLILEKKPVGISQNEVLGEKTVDIRAEGNLCGLFEENLQVPRVSCAKNENEPVNMFRITMFFKTIIENGPSAVACLGTA